MCQQCQSGDAETVATAERQAGFLNLRLALLPNSVRAVKAEISRDVISLLDGDGQPDDYQPTPEAMERTILVLAAALAQAVMAGKELDAGFITRKEGTKK